MARPDNVITLARLLPTAQQGGYAVGSFSPRYPRMILPILRAAQALASPAIVQISQKDLSRCGVDLEAFARAFYDTVASEGVSVPLTLHLDHTHDLDIIGRAIDASFTSVMIDASDRPLDENIAVTAAVVEQGHAVGVSVEGEIGTLGAYAFSETDESSSSTLTDPEEAGRFARESGVDALAVSIGTMHGVRDGATVALDIERLTAIRRVTDVPLVLHGGSGVPAAAMAAAVGIAGGGVSKVNLATDLELAMLAAIGSSRRLTDSDIEALDAAGLAAARAAVERVTREKMTSFLLSAGRAERLRSQ
ncbi:MAG TPA: class II fructose-bisphosphate aldolase [Trueperaceae bacterium]|nr:class II fructose-bisphosphate aldolase [Trueperaceae bacterium]